MSTSFYNNFKPSQQRSTSNVQQPASNLPQTVKNGISLGRTKISDYMKISVLGKGTYGEVHKCVYQPSGQFVAMKTYLFENKENGINYSTMREISLLSQLTKYEQFCELLDVIEEDTTSDKKIHCIFEFCDSVLSKHLNHR